jgi:hypothetical protein
LAFNGAGNAFGGGGVAGVPTQTLIFSGTALFPQTLNLAPFTLVTNQVQSSVTGTIQSTSFQIAFTVPPANFPPVVNATPLGGGLFQIRDNNGRPFIVNTGPNPVVGATLVVPGPIPNTTILTTPTTFNNGTLPLPSVAGPLNSVTITQNVVRAVCVYDPVLAHGAFRIAENESPRPRDRIFGTYNYFSNAQGINGVVGPSDVTQPVPGSQFGTVSALISGVPQFDPATGQVITGPLQITSLTERSILPDSVAAAAGRFSAVNRETFGFEKTFFCDHASIGIRASVIQAHGDGSLDLNSFGDTTIILKAAPFICNDNVFACGFAVTVPTGPGIPTMDGTIRDVLFQPFIGYIYNCGDGFVQGFESGIIPSSSRDVALLFSDMGFGYYLWRDPDCFFSMVVPTFEMHLTNALSHTRTTQISDAGFTPIGVTADGTPIIGVFSQSVISKTVFDLTAGVHVGMGAAVLSVGVNAPVTTPRPYNVEWFGQLNLYF